MLAADLTVGAGFDTGTQGAILSIGTNDNLIDRTRIGGKDVSAKGEPRNSASMHLMEAILRTRSEEAKSTLCSCLHANIR